MHSLLLFLPVFLFASSALAGTAPELAACRQYADLGFQTFSQRDQGRTKDQQLSAWQKIPASDPNHDGDLKRAAALIDYAYGPAGRKLSPAQARTQFFRGCRQASESSAAPGATPGR